MFLVQLPVPGEPLPAGVRGLAPSPFPFRLARNIQIHPVGILLDRVQQFAGKYPGILKRAHGMRGGFAAVGCGGC